MPRQIFLIFLFTGYICGFFLSITTLNAGVTDVTQTGTMGINDIQFMTENYPPYQFEVEGKLKGIWVDVLVEVFKRMDAKQSRDNIKLVPWARGYRATKQSPNTCLFNMIRTKERESLFKWAGPVTSGVHVLIALKNSNIHVESFEDLEQYKIGLVKDDFGESLLQNHDINNKKLLFSFGEHTAQEIIFELNNGIVDLWFIENISARWTLKKYGFNPKDYKAVYKMQTVDGYFAFNKTTSDNLISVFQKQLDAVIMAPVYQKILDNYLSGEMSQ